MPVGMPARLACTASASVPVARPRDSSVNGNSCSSAMSMSRSVTRGCSTVPRAITGPEPSGCLVIGPSSIPGWSVAKITSTTMARSGSRAKALVRDPAKLTSSWGTAVGGHQAGGLGRDVAADPVVQRARHQLAVGQLHRGDVDHAGVADAHHLASLVPVLGANVDVKVLDLGRLVALVGLDEVDRLASDHARHVAAAGGEHDALAHQHDRIPGPDLAEAQGAVVLDVG